MIIAIDFDGTIVEHKYPMIGKAAPLAIETITKWQEEEHDIILYTMRSGQELKEAVAYIFDAGIGLYGINTNPTQKKWTDSPKAYANIYIDDAACGCPLMSGIEGNRPMVDWSKISLETVVVEKILKLNE